MCTFGVLGLSCASPGGPEATLLESSRFQATGFADQSPTIQWNFSSGRGAVRRDLRPLEPGDLELFVQVPAGS